MKSLIHPLFFFLLTTQICFGQWLWTKYEGNPVLIGSGSSTWVRHIMGPWVIFNADSNRYEMFFFTSMDAWGPEPPYKIGKAYSSDKINWTKHPDPIISPTPGFWDARGAYHPCVIREDSVYKMWYMALKDSWYPIRICYAVSNDGGLTWTKHPDPVLTPGTAQWESYGVAVPLVLKEAEGYVMYYSGLSPSGVITKIGRAISTDGLNWQRDTVHSPVLSADTGWEAKIFASAIVTVEDIYYLYYCGYTYSSPGGAGGVAFSTDGGLTFQKYPNNPVISTGSSGWDNYFIETDCVIYEDSTFYMWYAGSSNPYLIKIGLATSPIGPVSVDDETIQPAEFRLEQNFPNPFNSVTAIQYSIPQRSNVALKTYDILGSEITTLVNEEKDQGIYTVNFDANNLASGLYLYRIQAGSFIDTRKMILLK